MVQPGLEEVAGEEIVAELGGDIRKLAPGAVIFRVPEIDRRLLELRTTEDVFLLAWGTDSLTHRAVDLDNIEKWTAKQVDWPTLFKLHHAIRPRPRGRPSYHLVTQMTGQHVYFRKHAQQALARGLAGHIPESWRYADEGASFEVWLTIHGSVAYCGVRLSDRTMRHRQYKVEHIPASLRPTVAAAMVRLAGVGYEQTVLDPMCGAGTILCEHIEAGRAGRKRVKVWGGDRELAALRAAAANLRHCGPALLARWDACRLPLPPACVERITCNPPFGKQLADPEQVAPLYAQALRECDRVLVPSGRAVFLVLDAAALRQAARAVGWQTTRQLTVQVLGQRAEISVWRKPA